jgi:hypothetical protein
MLIVRIGKRDINIERYLWLILLFSNASVEHQSQISTITEIEFEAPSLQTLLSRLKNHIFGQVGYGPHRQRIWTVCG